MLNLPHPAFGPLLPRSGRRGLFCIAAALAQVPCPALAQDVPDFYRGKDLRLILSAGAGGGYATYAQAFAPFLSAHLPGKPTIIIQNMPGAGGIRAMQYFFANAPKDGTVIGLVHSSVPFAPLFDLPGANFDPRKFGWIGSMNRSNEICTSWHTSGIKTWQDMMTKEFIVGGTGGGSQMETLPVALNQIFGTRMKVISGYTAGTDVFLAMERGEVMGRCGVSYSGIMSVRPDWLPMQKAFVPVQLSMKRSKTFADVPAIGEFAKDAATRQTLDVLFAYQDMDRPFLAPPGIPATRLATLRKAFHDAMNDPGFIAEAQRLNLELEEVSGEFLQKVLDDTFALPRERVESAKAALGGMK